MANVKLEDVRKAGLENDLIELVRSFIPRGVAEQDRGRLTKAVLEIAHEDGLVGPSMMRQLTLMKYDKVVEAGLYDSLITLYKETEKRLGAGPQPQSNPSAAAPAPTIQFEQVEHPDKPEPLKEFDFKWPVGFLDLFHGSTRSMGYKTSVVLSEEARTKEDHFKVAQSRNVSETQFNTYWNFWGDTAPNSRPFVNGWVLEGQEGAKFILRPRDPKTELWRPA